LTNPGYATAHSVTCHPTQMNAPRLNLMAMLHGRYSIHLWTYLVYAWIKAQLTKYRFTVSKYV